MSVNKAILVGNVGKDPDVRYLEGGTSVASFSLATTEVYKNRNGERVSQTEWHNIVAWRQLAELAEKFITKGKQLYVEGRITNRSWEDKEGNKRYTTEIVASTIRLLGKKGDESSVGMDQNQSPAASPSPKIEEPELNEESTEEDDLPF